MHSTKTAVVMLIVLSVVITIGFTLMLTRKQTIVDGEIKTVWKKKPVESENKA